MTERRKYPRKVYEAPILSYNISPAWTHNISLGGICLQIQENIPQGSYQSFEFFMPKGYPILALGTVIWSKALDEENYLIGVDFWDLDEYSRNQIINLLKGDYTVNIKKTEEKAE